MIQYKHMLKPTILFAAGSFAGAAQAAVFVNTLDISAASTGTQIAIGVPLSSAQFTFTASSSNFGYGPKDTTTLHANGTAGIFQEGVAATTTPYIPNATNSFSSSFKTGGSFPADSYYGLRFDVGSSTTYGYALVDGAGHHISQIAYDAPSQLDITSAAPAPEPATWAEMILGMGLAGATLRRRRQSALRAAA